MEISAAGRRARELAGHLVEHLAQEYPSLHLAIIGGDALEAVETETSINVLVIEEPAKGSCSIAGTCDVDRRTITVTQASLGRTRYSVLHELGHLMMSESDDYQDAYVDLAGSVQNRARLTEDVCEAFAAILLLPHGTEQALELDIRLDARGLRNLSASSKASREACAVWVSQHMRAPGYALICSSDGSLQFAARSGDAVPLARGSAQVGSVLQPLFSGESSLRSRGRLRFGSGALGEQLYVDGVRDGRLVYAVAVTDSPDWPVLHQPASGAAVEAIEAWCDDCGASFRAYRVCADCGAPKHPDCGRCECDLGASSTERPCMSCFLIRHASQFDGDSTVCKDCLA